MAQRYTYQLTGIHHRRAYIKGDLEHEIVPIQSEVFRTRKAGNERLKELEQNAKKNNYQTTIRCYSRGEEPSFLDVYTNDTWTHENTGEKMREYYFYKLSKKVL